MEKNVPLDLVPYVKRKLMVSLCLIASMCMIGLFAGCGNQSRQRAAITTVVNELYTCPNEVFSEAYAKESSKDPKGVTGEFTAMTEDNSPTLKYISDTYRQYFSDSAYLSFLANNYAWKYQLPGIEKKWSSKVTKTSLKSEGKAKYSFACDIDVTDNSGNAVNRQITGTIEFDESGKIRWFNEYKTFLYD